MNIKNLSSFILVLTIYLLVELQGGIRFRCEYVEMKPREGIVFMKAARMIWRIEGKNVIRYDWRSGDREIPINLLYRIEVE